MGGRWPAGADEVIKGDITAAAAATRVTPRAVTQRRDAAQSRSFWAISSALAV
jgi:hypothetical protein